jgi:hypothetical protein
MNSWNKKLCPLSGVPLPKGCLAMEVARTNPGKRTMHLCDHENTNNSCFESFDACVELTQCVHKSVSG